MSAAAEPGVGERGEHGGARAAPLRVRRWTCGRRRSTRRCRAAARSRRRSSPGRARAARRRRPRRWRCRRAPRRTAGRACATRAAASESRRASSGTASRRRRRPPHRSAAPRWRGAREANTLALEEQAEEITAAGPASAERAGARTRRARRCCGRRVAERRPAARRRVALAGRRARSRGSPRCWCRGRRRRARARSGRGTRAPHPRSRPGAGRASARRLLRQSNSPSVRAAARAASTPRHLADVGVEGHGLEGAGRESAALRCAESASVGCRPRPMQLVAVKRLSASGVMPAAPMQQDVGEGRAGAHRHGARHEAEAPEQLQPLRRAAGMQQRSQAARGAPAPRSDRAALPKREPHATGGVADAQQQHPVRRERSAGPRQHRSCAAKSL